MNSLTKAIGNKLGKVKNAVIDKTSDVLSAPTRAYYGLKEKQANSDANVLKKARQYDNAPNTPGSDAFKMRSMADAIRNKRK